MKILLTLTLGAAMAAPFALAGPLSDVPAGHWAAQSVRRLAAEKIMGSSARGKFQGDKPVTRYELALTLDRLVRYLEAAHKPLSAQITPGAVVLPKAANAKTRQALVHLAQGGFIVPRSPLLQADKVVTARELTDVLARVTIRLSERSLPPTTH